MVRHRKNKQKMWGWLPNFNLKGLTSKTSSLTSALTRAFDALPNLDDVLDPVLNILGLSQNDPADDLNGQVLYGVLRGDIVGLQYYNGTVNNKEMVSLVRQPDNQYDPNAVKVTDVMGGQVGHIKKELAKSLAVIMDNKLARIDGIVPFGSTNVYSMPVDLTFYGLPENKDRTLSTLKLGGFTMIEGLSEYPSGPSKKASTSGQTGGTSRYESAAVRRTFMNPAEMKNELDKLFEQLTEGDKSSECDPCKAIVTPLFSHQKKALCWMIEAENSNGLPPFWEEKASNYFNTIAVFTTKKRPDPIRGGILADDMGLGKTLDIISLILTNFHNEKPLAYPVPGQLRPSKISKMERLKIYRLAANSSDETKVKKSEEDGDYVLPSTSRQIRKPLLLKASMQNIEPMTSTKILGEKTAQIIDLEKPSPEPEVEVETKSACEEKSNVMQGPAEKNSGNVTKLVKSASAPICQSNSEGGKVNGLPSPNVKSRPKREIRRPAHYDDNADEEDDVPANKKVKKTSQCSSQRRTDCKADVPSESSSSQMKGNAEGHRTVALRKSATAVVTSVCASASDFSAAPSAVETASSVLASGTVPGCSGNTVTGNASVSSSSGVIELSSDSGSELPDLDMLDGELPDLDMLEIPDPAAYAQISGKSNGRTEATGPRPTLIVCPLSTLSNWLEQIEEHVDESVLLHIYTFYGSSRTHDHYMLADQDIVLTTYQTLSADCKSNGPLQKVHWLRIVLDEGHTIRNPSAQMTKAILSLQGDRRWVLTGTPIQNSIKDLWSLVNFLNIKPFEEKSWWDRTIARPLSHGDPNAVKRIQSLLGKIALRRVKTQIVNGKPIVALPSRDVFVETIRLSDDERKVYDAMQTEGKLIVSRYCRQGTLLNHYGEVLAIMLRLRQMCLHPFLVAKAAEAAGQMIESGADPTSDEFRQKLIDKILLVLNSGSDEECPICLELLRSPVITHCAHVFCRTCIESVITSEKPLPKCPMCRGEVSSEKLVEVPPDYKKDEPESFDNQPWLSSSKIESLMCSLIKLRNDDSTIKSIVVSQFTSYLTLIEIPLRENGFRFVRLDGTMTNKQRIAAIEAFSDTDPSSPTIFLLSLKAGGVGINLTAACRVFLMDPAWNPAAEEQCFDRCHRLGQTRPVVITKYIVENSIEEKMVQLQEKKRELAHGVFGEQKPTAEQRRQERMNDLKNLMDL